MKQTIASNVAVITNIAGNFEYIFKFESLFVVNYEERNFNYNRFQF